MQIRSNFRDYIDSAMSHDQDRALIYKRYKTKPEVLNGRNFPYIGDGDRCSRWYDRRNIVRECVAIGFCGHVYLTVQVGALNPDPMGKPSEFHKWCYTLDDVDKFIEQHLPEEVESYRYTAKRWSDQHKVKGNMHGQRLYFEKMFDEYKKAEIKDKHQDLFFNKHCPVFIIEHKPINKAPHWQYEITYNPCLKDYEFFRVFEPYQAFQEISMFLGNMAEPRKPIPNVSDSDLLEAKGFDKRFSFRKDRTE